MFAFSEPLEVSLPGKLTKMAKNFILKLAKIY